MREAAQMVSYEIPMGICALVPIVAAGSLNLGEIGDMQTGGMLNWFVFHDPFTFIAFFVYFVVATASCKRAPFDLAEAESELVGGFHTEYSGMRWSFFFMGEYASMFAVCGIAAILFLGGWSTGLAGVDQTLSLMRSEGGVGSYVAGVIGLAVFAAKALFGVFVQIWLRWSVPRIRIDQVITVCLKYLVPISCFLFLGAIVWPLFLLLVTGYDSDTEWYEPVGGQTTWNEELGERFAKAIDGETPATDAENNEELSPDTGESATGEEPADTKTVTLNQSTEVSR
jgi:NADH-quinone oxidoreductase subunit H